MRIDDCHESGKQVERLEPAVSEDGWSAQGITGLRWSRRAQVPA